MHEPYRATCQPTFNGTSGAIGRTVDGDVQVGLGIFDHYIGQTGQHHLQVAALVRTNARAVDVGDRKSTRLNSSH